MLPTKKRGIAWIRVPLPKRQASILGICIFIGPPGRKSNRNKEDIISARINTLRLHITVEFTYLVCVIPANRNSKK